MLCNTPVYGAVTDGGDSGGILHTIPIGGYRDKRIITRWRVDTTRTKGYRMLHPCKTESFGN